LSIEVASSHCFDVGPIGLQHSSGLLSPKSKGTKVGSTRAEINEYGKHLYMNQYEPGRHKREQTDMPKSAV